jgi:hypothetical protein
MSDKVCLLRFEHPELGVQSVIAAGTEIHDEPKALPNSKENQLLCS